MRRLQLSHAKLIKSRIASLLNLHGFGAYPWSGRCPRNRSDIERSASPRRESNPRPLPYQGSALPTELHGPNFISRPGTAAHRRRAIVTAYGAGNGIRTRDPELGRLALYQLSYSRPHGAPKKESPRSDYWWRGEDSNLRRHKPADLQSAPFGHSGTSPLPNSKPEPIGGFEPSTFRIVNPWITNSTR